MAVFVDDMRAQFRRMIMCHLIADTHDELIAMARAIGVATKWIQHAGTPHEHFDISLTKRALVIRHGAIPITWRQCAAMTKRLQIEGKLGSPRSSLTWLTNYYQNRDRYRNDTKTETEMRQPKLAKPKPSYPSPYDPVHTRKLPKHERSTEIRNHAYVGQLVVIVIGESRAFAGEVVEVDSETGQILVAYITGGRMLRYLKGFPPTCGLLRDWTDKQTVFSLCPDDGWSSLMRARDVLEPLYEKWKLEQIGVKSLTKAVAVDVEDAGLTDCQRKAWLAKNSIPRPAKLTKVSK